MLHLQLIQPGVDAVPCDQLIVSAALDDFSVLQHDNAVGVADGGQAMGDDQSSPISYQSLERFLHGAFAFIIERAGSLIEDDQRRVFEEEAGDADSLPLPRR